MLLLFCYDSTCSLGLSFLVSTPTFLLMENNALSVITDESSINHQHHHRSSMILTSFTLFTCLGAGFSMLISDTTMLLLEGKKHKEQLE